MTKIRRHGVPRTTTRRGCALLLLISSLGTIHALSSVNPAAPNRRNAQYGGGRTAGEADMPNLLLDNGDSNDESCANRWSPTPLQPSEARVTICQVTDVYTLEHFASLKTMLQETRATLHQYYEEASNDAASEKETASSKKGSQPEYLTDCYEDNDGVVSMLTGDFLAPYLLSSVDRGKGMMNAMAATPIDYLTWGNHEGTLRVNGLVGLLIWSQKS